MCPRAEAWLPWRISVPRIHSCPVERHSHTDGPDVEFNTEQEAGSLGASVNERKITSHVWKSYEWQINDAQIPLAYSDLNALSLLSSPSRVRAFVKGGEGSLCTARCDNGEEGPTEVQGDRHRPAGRLSWCGREAAWWAETGALQRASAALGSEGEVRKLGGGFRDRANAGEGSASSRGTWLSRPRLCSGVCSPEHFWGLIRTQTR